MRGAPGRACKRRAVGTSLRSAALHMDTNKIADTIITVVEMIPGLVALVILAIVLALCAS